MRCGELLPPRIIISITINSTHINFDSNAIKIDIFLEKFNGADFQAVYQTKPRRLP
jgi:hypothetical protein